MNKNILAGTLMMLVLISGGPLLGRFFNKENIFSNIMMLAALPGAGTDIDGDGTVDRYDAYLADLRSRGVIPQNIVFPIRAFTLDTRGHSLEESTPQDSFLHEKLETGQFVNSWITKYEKKGHLRFMCDPPMLNISFDKFDSRGRPRPLFNGNSTYSIYPTLRYQEVRFVSNCDALRDYLGNESRNGFNASLDIQLAEHTIFKIFRTFGIPTVDVAGYGEMSFVNPDPRYTGKKYNYIILQRDNENDDPIPFTQQFKMGNILVEDGNWERWQVPWGGNTPNDGFRYLTYTDVLNNLTQTVELDAESSIRYRLLTNFLKVGDRSVLHNEDYGFDNVTGLVKAIPYGFDFSFDGCDILNPRNILYGELSRLSDDVRPHYKELYYKVAREIFGKEENLYKMLLSVDQFPFTVDKTKLKKYLRIAFYRYARYYTSEDFAVSLGQVYVPISLMLPFANDAEASRAEQDLLTSCVRVYEPAPEMNISIVGNPTLEFDTDPSGKGGDNGIVGRAHFTVTISATSSELLLSKSSLFISSLRDNTSGNSVGSSLWSRYSKPENVIDEPGPYYVLPKGITARFVIQTDVYYQDDLPGSYYVSLDKLWLGSRYGLVGGIPVNKTNVVSLGADTPFIRVVSPNGGERFFANDNMAVTWTSSNIDTSVESRNIEIRILRKLPSIESMYSTLVPNTGRAEIIIPSDIRQGSYYVEVRCATSSSCQTGDMSNNSFDIISTESILASVVGSPLLSLTYNNRQEEVSLKARFIVNVRAGENGLYIPKQWAFSVGIYSTDGSTGGPMQTSFSPAVPSSVVDRGTDYFIPAGQTVKFDLIAEFNPLTMFAGTYSSRLHYLFFREDNGVPFLDSRIPINNTNEVTIIGEISPYITAINPSSVDVNHRVTITGVRFSPMNNRLMVSGKEFVLPSSNNGTQISFVPREQGILTGRQPIQVTHPTTGQSNQLGFEVTTTEPVAVTLAYLSTQSKSPPIVGEEIDVIVDAKNTTNETLYDVLVSVSDQQSWGDLVRVDFAPGEEKRISMKLYVRDIHATYNPHLFTFTVNGIKVTTKSLTVTPAVTIIPVDSLQPSITTIVPPSATHSNVVTLTGTNFSLTGNKVMFSCPLANGNFTNSVISNISSNLGRTINVAVPTNTSFPLPIGTSIHYPWNCIIIVMNSNGTSNRFPFTITNDEISIIIPNHYDVTLEWFYLRRGFTIYMS